MTRLAHEIDHVKQLYPDALFIGVADGAADNWSFLNQYTSIQVTDFWHATEYLAAAAEAIFHGKKQQAQSMAQRCFSHQELNNWNQLVEPRKTNQFYAYWCAKEAFLNPSSQL